MANGRPMKAKKPTGNCDVFRFEEKVLTSLEFSQPIQIGRLEGQDLFKTCPICYTYL